MKDIVIIGAGGCGKDALWLAERLNRNVLGFLDDTPEKQHSSVLGYPVLGKIADAIHFAETEFVIALAAPRARESIFNALMTQFSPSFATLIDPSVIIGKNTHIGTGCLIFAGVILTTETTVSDQTIIHINATVGHDVVINDFVTIAPNVSVSGNVTLGNKVELGTNSTIKEKVTIEQGVMVGMGSVISKDVEANKVIAGNPARAIKTLSE